ncbi:MAG: Hint domain-containing protein [Pseudomonadota bacterium]
MVERCFFAFGSEALVIDESSPLGTPGAAIIGGSNMPDGTIVVFLEGGAAQRITIDEARGDMNAVEHGASCRLTVLDGGSLVAAGACVDAGLVLTLQQINEGGDAVGPQISLSAYSQSGAVPAIWGFSTDSGLVPGARYRKIAGNFCRESKAESGVACFAKGTLIRTAEGAVPVEALQIGTEIWTREDPRTPVLWIGSTRVEARGSLAPVRIEAGVLGNARPLIVAPQQRVLIEGYRAHLLFGEPEMLAPALSLLAIDGVSRAPAPWIRYHHFATERHAITEAEGVLTEISTPGETAQTALDQAKRVDLSDHFPALGQKDSADPAKRSLATQTEGRAVAVMIAKALGS